MTVPDKIRYKPLTEKTWDDFVELFGERGACGGCWCMAWRFNAADFNKHKGAGNRRAIKSLVKKKEQLGLIAYDGKKPIGWCSFAPREKFIRLEKSKVLAKVDDEKVWSVSCFFVTKEYRRKSLSVELLKAAAEFCRKKKVKILEGYPAVPYNSNIPASFAWTGIPSAFVKAGFKEAARRSKPRPIMRYYL